MNRDHRPPGVRLGGLVGPIVRIPPTWRWLVGDRAMSPVAMVVARGGVAMMHMPVAGLMIVAVHETLPPRERPMRPHGLQRGSAVAASNTPSWDCPAQPPGHHRQTAVPTHL